MESTMRKLLSLILVSVVALGACSHKPVKNTIPDAGTQVPASGALRQWRRRR